MAEINQETGTVLSKFVVYGAPGSGKSTVIEFLKASYKQPATQTPALYDHFVVEGQLRTHPFRIEIFAVPGDLLLDDIQRRAILRQVDSILFIADSLPEKRQENREWYERLRADLDFMGPDGAGVKTIFMFHKRDLKDVMPVEVMLSDLNKKMDPWFESSVQTGKGFREAFISAMKVFTARLS